MQPKVFSFIVEITKPFRFRIAGLFLIAAIWAVDLSLRPYLLKIILDRSVNLNPKQAFDILSGPAILYVSLFLLKTICFRLYDLLWIYIHPPLKGYIGEVLMKRMMQHSQGLFQNQFAGALGARIKDVMSGVPDLLRLCINELFAHFTALIIAIITLATVHLKFAFLLSAWAGIFILGLSLFAKKFRILNQIFAEHRSVAIGHIVDILSNIMSVRLFAAAKFESKKLQNFLDAYVHADKKLNWYALGLNIFQGFSFVFYQGVCLFWLIRGFQDGYVSAGDFALILTINISIVDCLWSLSKDIGHFAEIVGNISQGLRVVLSPIEIQDKPHAPDLLLKKGEIVFDEVQFEYRGIAPIFENKSVRIAHGEKVGLVGYSGGGKSTFVNLILRLYDVSAGRILIDGQDIREVTQNSLHRQIGMIPQDPVLFHRSLMDNIRYGRPAASDEEVKKAAKRADAHGFIVALPQGYDSMVGERGVKLSGGQRQRIAIARAILKNAPILILDEATSQLDSLTEQNIQVSLWELMQDKTTIVIAHRLSTLLHMDRILVFDRGQIVEDGSHETLLAQNGLYKTLWSAQVGGFLPEQQNV